jgi:hypothetical protein
VGQNVGALRSQTLPAANLGSDESRFGVSEPARRSLLRLDATRTTADDIRLAGRLVLALVRPRDFVGPEDTWRLVPVVSLPRRLSQLLCDEVQAIRPLLRFWWKGSNYRVPAGIAAPPTHVLHPYLGRVWLGQISPQPGHSGNPVAVAGAKAGAGELDRGFRNPAELPAPRPLKSRQFCQCDPRLLFEAHRLTLFLPVADGDTHDHTRGG